MGTYNPPLPVQNFQPKIAAPPVRAIWLNAVDNILQGNVPATGPYDPSIVSGQVQVTGPNGNLISYGDLVFELQGPNPSGIPCPVLSLGGANKLRACLTTDAQVAGLPGIQLIIAAGEVEDDQTGGALLALGGASNTGQGGSSTFQGGTSLTGPAGHTFVQGGNSTAGLAGNLYLSGGLAGAAGGGSVHLILTDTGGGPTGSIVFRNNSTVLWTINEFGAVFFGATGAGTPGQVLISQGPNALPAWVAGTGGSLLYPQTVAEANASPPVVPVNFNLPPGHLYRYGNNITPGTTDMTSAVKAWASVGGNLIMPVAEQVLISSQIPLVSNSTITITKGAQFVTNTPDINMFVATGCNNISITGGTFVQTVNGLATRIGQIQLISCNACSVHNVECIGWQWMGILLTDSTNCTIRECYLHNALGLFHAPGVFATLTDAADIGVYQTSSFNVIADNICHGGTAMEHGIMLLGAGAGIRPTRNIVKGNNVAPHNTYGILHYVVEHGNTYNIIEGNYIEGITGGDGVTIPGNPNGGAGIYNQGGGGTVIIGNTIVNCCINTSNLGTLTPAGIGLNSDAATLPVSVVGNNIFDMAQGYGIEVVNGPANIEGNTIKFTLGVAANIGIYVFNASDINITGNHVTLDNAIPSGQGIFVLGNVNQSGITISGNYVKGCAQRHIRVDTAAGITTNTNVSVTGNTMSGGAPTCIPLQLGNMVYGTVTGNVANADTSNALVVQSSMFTRITNNTLFTSGAVSVMTSGVCTGSYFDKSNYWNQNLQNGATGLICEQLANAIPVAGNISAVGDRIEQSVPVIGQPKGWRCTTAGNPGAWTSEGNL